MPEFGFPPQAAAARINTAVSDLRARAQTAQIEVVTGRYQDPAAALDGQTGELHLLQKALGDNADRGRIISLAEGRSATMQTAIGGVSAQMDALILDATHAIEIGNDATRETVGAGANITLEAIVAALNTRFGDRALFSGDAGDLPALADAGMVLGESVTILNAAVDANIAYGDLTAAFNDPSGMFEIQLYLGGTGDAPAADVAPGERVAYGERGDDPAFRDVIRDVAVLALALDPASGLDNSKRQILADRALGGLRNSVADVVAVAARLGISEARIGDARASNFAAEAALTISYNALAGRDQFEAAEEMRALEVQLQTAYLTTARLANLNLASFLR